MRTGALHHVGEQPFVFQNRAGLEQIVVEGLALVILHEQRGAQRVEKTRLPDIDVRIMREHARLHVACSVDVQVAAPASDAAADKLAIVLEVKREQGLLLAHLADEAVEVLALVGVHHKRGGRADADGHVREDPREKRPLLDEPVEELLVGDGTCVGAGVAARHAEGQAVFAQKLHGAGHLGVRSLAAAGVGCLLEALDADGGHEIGDADHILHELLVDERRIGER